MKVLFSLVLLLCYCSRAAKATCDIVTNTDFDDEALLLQEFSGSNPVLEIFKIHRVKIWKANFRRCRICVERDAVGGIETTYILNDGTMRTVCHGKRDRNNDLKLDATLGQDEFPTKMVVRTGDDRAYKVTLSTSKRALSGVGGSGSPRTNQKTFQESGQVIIAFKGKVAGDGIMGDFTRPVFNTQPDGETAFKVEIIGDVEYTEVMNTGFAEPVNSADGKVTVDNSDPAATEPATQTLTLEQEFRKSETNTVGLTVCPLCCPR